jgi:hypothetical protein
MEPHPLLCPNCSADNRPSARFCEACGTALGGGSSLSLGPVLPTVDLDRLPYPLARPCQILRDYASQNQAVASWLQVKDVFESAVKLAAAVAVADYLASPRFTPASFANLLRPVFGKPPAFGDWLALLRGTLACHKVAGQSFDPVASKLVVSRLYQFAFSTGRGNSDGLTPAFTQLTEVVKWRNDHLGHGALGMNPHFIADDLRRQLALLVKVLGELSFFSDYRLVSESWTSAVAEWTGPKIPLAAPAGPSGALRYLRIYLEERTTKPRRLDLTPLAVIDLHGRDEAAPAPAFFFFDKMDFTSRGLKRGDVFLDYDLGKKLVTSPEHPCVPEFLNRLTAAERTAFYDQIGQFSPQAAAELLSPAEPSYDSRLQEALRRIQFGGDVDRRFVLPAYLADAVRKFVDRSRRGYLHLVGEAGTGKSWLVAKLADRKVLGDLAAGVLVYHIRLGSRQSTVVFSQEITRQAERADGHSRITGLLLGAPSEVRPPHQMMREFLAEVIGKGPIGRVLLAVDGLDELTDSASIQAHIADYLPIPSELPDQCWVIIASRPTEQCRRRTVARLKAMQEDAIASGVEWVSVEIDPASAENASLLRRYLTTYSADKPCGLRDPQLRQDWGLVDRILRSSGGVFLKASHLANLLNTGGIASGQPLPGSFAGLYEAYLGHFASSVGHGLFDQVYRPILGLLGAARDPVSLPIIAGALGLPPEKVLFALFDLGELLLSHRFPDDPWTYFEPGHEEYRDFMAAHPHLLIPAHAAITTYYLQSFNGNWALAADTRQGRYGLNHLAAHAEAAGAWAKVKELLSDDYLAARRASCRDWAPCVGDAARLTRTALAAGDRAGGVKWAVVAAVGASTLYERTLDDAKAPTPTLSRPTTLGLFADLFALKPAHLGALRLLVAACGGPRQRFDCVLRLFHQLGAGSLTSGRRRAFAAELVALAWQCLDHCQSDEHLPEMWAMLWVCQACTDTQGALRRIDKVDPGSWQFVDAVAQAVLKWDALPEEALLPRAELAKQSLAAMKRMFVARTMNQAARYAETIGFFAPEACLAAVSDWNDPNERKTLEYKAIRSGAYLETDWAIASARKIPDSFHRAISLVEVLSVAWNRLADTRQQLLGEALDAVTNPMQRERVSFAIADLLAHRDPLLALRHIGLMRNDQPWSSGKSQTEYLELADDRQRFPSWDDVNKEFRRIYFEAERHRFQRRIAWEGLGRRMPLHEVGRVLEWLDTTAGESEPANLVSNPDFASWRTDMWRGLLPRIPLDQPELAADVCRRALTDLAAIVNQVITSQHATELWDAARPFGDTMAAPFERFITLQHNLAHLRLSQALLCAADDPMAALEHVARAVRQPDVCRFSPEMFKMLLPTAPDEGQLPFVTPEGWFDLSI